MAVSNTPNHQLLNAWQRWNEVAPFLFNQITGAGLYAPTSTPGEGVFVQPERELIVQGIVYAVALGTNYLRTFHRPTYVTERLLLNPYRGLYRSLLQTSWHHVQAIGQRGTTEIEADAAIVYSDSDGDGIDDLATITVPTTVTDVSEIQAFFRVTDGAPATADERWRIEPLTVKLSGGNAILTGHRSLFVQPSLWATPFRAPNFNAASKIYGDSSNPADFVTEVAIYRVYPDATNAVRFNRGSYCHGGEGCEFVTDAGCMRIDNSRLGLLSPRQQDWFCGGYYEWVDVDYLAGYPLDPLTGQPDAALERAFIRLTNAELPHFPHNLSDQSMCIWTNDAILFPPDQGLEGWRNNPFGALVGHIQAYRVMSLPQYQIGEGGAIRSR